MNASIRTDVAVVGAGPAGLALSLELSRYGVEHVLIEQRADINPHPRASIVNTRTGEILRRWGLQDQVEARCLPRDRGHSVYFAESFTGEVHGVISLSEDLQRFARRIDASPAVLSVVAQDELESILWQAALGTVYLRVLRGHRAHEIHTTARPRLALRAADSAVEVQARYVVGADGATGWTRSQLGIGVEGPGVLGAQLNIYFIADLSHITRARPSVLTWVLDPRYRGVFVALNGTDRWCFHTRLEPGTATSEFDEALGRELLRGAIGDPDVEVEIVNMAPWSMRAEVARTYRRGDVVLIGDAAHVMPPTGGFGMNTAIQDAHALGWRLAGLVQGWCGEQVLDDYEAERRPVAWRNMIQSSANLRALSQLGLDLPRDASQRRLDQPDLQAAIAFQRDHFDFLNQEIGYVYHRGDLRDAEALGSGEQSIRDYTPDGRVGARMPHLWAATPDGVVSTLDCIGDEFALVTDPFGSVVWTDVLANLPDSARPAVRLVILGDEALLRTSSKRWSELTGNSAGGALLVRPDGHVAARFKTVPTDPLGRLSEALNEAAGRMADPVRHREVV